MIDLRFWRRDRKRSHSATPLPNSYWIEPGKLLGGEHPCGETDNETRERLQMLLGAGVTSFVDLTEEGEMTEYQPLLQQLDERVRYWRIPVLDHGVPDSAAHMTEIIDVIAAELSGQHLVYVHCRAGIGRTGMAAACHLIASGQDNEAALESLQTLWKQSARSRRWPRAPETEAQVQFVKAWVDTTRAGRPAADLASRREGALVGLAIAEALGRFHARQGDLTLLSASQPVLPGPHAATTCAALSSLCAHGQSDPADQLQRYAQWLRAHGDEAPAELKRAVAVWQWSRKVHAGSHDPRQQDAHTLPRALAAALFAEASVVMASDLAVELSRTTQQSPVVLDLCRFWACLFTDALAGVERSDLIALRGPSLDALRQRKLKAPVKELLDEPSFTASTQDDAVSATRAALHVFAAQNTLREAILETLAQRSAPAALALCGALCGAYYGLEAIPLGWRRHIVDERSVRELASGAHRR